MEGKTVSHYRILEKIGEGGMGEVYLAEDTSLKRKVALKFLPDYLQQDQVAQKRFLREAQSAAALDHPYICKIFETGEAQGKNFIAMEYVRGQTLKEKLLEGPVPLKQTLQIGMEIAEALEEAHKAGIAHRDLKPANIMLTSGGHVKVMDFGLAKKVVRDDGTEQDITSALTREGTTLGTLAYMSPEQLRGEPVDTRTDIFSFGIVLYELLSGVHPFRKPKQVETTSAILHEDPPPISRYTQDSADVLQHTLEKMFAKDPDKRYQSVSEVRNDLDRLSETGSLLSFLIRALIRPAVAIPGVLLILAAAFFIYQFIQRADRQRWALAEGIPEIIRLKEQEEYAAAVSVAEEVERCVPEDPRLAEFWEEISVVRSIETTPQGADVYMRAYRDIEGEWRHLGKSPLEGIRIPRGFFRWKVEKKGYETAELACFSKRLESLSLHEKGTIPSEMVWVPGGKPWYVAGVPVAPLPIDDFLMDRYEVTNEQFKAFVDVGGYRRQQYWKHSVVKDGTVLSFQDAMREFVDQAGRSGPATWELGEYPKGEDNYPVTGISWYEAAAYAEFAGKSLPTVYHWSWAAEPAFGQYIVPLSNFRGEGPTAVGSSAGMSPHGTYDMAGNLKEWCWNASDGKRFILGGAWSEPEYMFGEADAQAPFDRLPTYGFRCVKYLSEPAEAATSPIKTTQRRDFSVEKPVSDKTFAIYRRLYSYDKSELNASIDSVDESGEYWTKETVSFDAAYGNERMGGLLFLPRNSDPPYQTAVFFPGSYAQELRSSQEFPVWRADFIIRGGRALFLPIYKGTFERGGGAKDVVLDEGPNTYRDHVIMWSKDLGRSIDYLETRPDIDSEKLAFYGASWGASMGAILLAVEDRLKVSVLHVGGFMTQRKVQPEVDQLNFAPRVTIPVLMLNGRYDFDCPLDTAQKPMFQNLGTPLEHKRHIIYDTGHAVPRNALIKETDAWLDRYLGPVELH